MSLQLRQNLQLTQQLVMTPQLQQAIKLLQYSRLELVETVQQALLENPLLEERQVQEDDQAPQEPQAKEGRQEISIEEQSLLRNAEWDDYLGNFSSTSRQKSEREVPDDVVSFESVCAAKPSLESHLLWQLYLSNMTPRQREIGEAIIGNLDPSGYLTMSVEEMVEAYSYQAEEVESVLQAVQRFDPVGVGSRNLQECLITQLEVQGEDDPLLFQLVREHLEELQGKNFQALARKLNVSLERLREYCGIIQTCEPRPGSSFSGGDVFYVSPDAYIYSYEDDFVILLNDDGLPDLQINQYYLEQLDQTKGKSKEFLQEQMRDALWLMKSIYQRQRTLYRVLESILKFQKDFFRAGVTGLKPLILKDVAEDIEMHESTVSRITTNKYVSTPYGIFELKYFFNSGLGVDGGGQVASESVKATIKKMLSEEDPAKPLSDKQIVEMLNDTLQVNIARRTVAKYREAMGIPSSTKRKRAY
jgi:RNA polymerase sigma-54 factor